MSPMVTKLPRSSGQGYLILESLVSVCLPKWGVYAPKVQERFEVPTSGAEDEDTEPSY
jgi:hypothetical protein